MLCSQDLQVDGEPVDVERWARVAMQTLISQGVSIGQLDLFFVTEEEIARLNQLHMGHPGPTDVLSFPLDEADSVQADMQADGQDNQIPVHLGDIVLCPSVARAQMMDHAGSEAAEFALLTIHGVLHILGHDHVETEDSLAMQQVERRILATMGFSHPISQ